MNWYRIELTNEDIWPLGRLQRLVNEFSLARLRDGGNLGVAMFQVGRNAYVITPEGASDPQMLVEYGATQVQRPANADLMVLMVGDAGSRAALGV